MDLTTGPFIYLDIILTFLFILIPELLLNWMYFASWLSLRNFVLVIQQRQISPLILYRYLKPLYSSLGGSTIRADPLMKSPSCVDRRKDPL